MKIELTTIDKLKKLVNMPIDLAIETLGDGQASLEAETFAAGEAVMIVGEGDQREPLPIGEYELDNGMILVVVEEGIISEMKEKAAEGEEEAEEEVAASDNKAETPLPKAVIESIVKETKFSKEEVDAKDSEIEALKAKIVELEKVEDTEEVDLSKKAVHNPEEVSSRKVAKHVPNRKLTTEQIVMNKIANIK